MSVDRLPDSERVVITGLGMVGPLGCDVPTFWRNLKEGRSGIANISTVLGYHLNDAVDIAGMVRGFDPGRFLHPSETRKTHLSHQYALVAAIEASMDAGILNGIPTPAKNRNNEVLVGIEPERVGVIIGTGVGGAIHLEEIEDIELLGATRSFQERLKTGEIQLDPEIFEGVPSTNLLSDGYIENLMRAVMLDAGRRPGSRSPFYILRALPERTASLVSLTLGTQGDLYTPIAACATGVRAIIEAYKTIKLGDADAVLAGSTDALVTPLALLSFHLIKALSTRNDDPEGASMPFDKNSSGFVMSEGAAVLVVESLASAKKRGRVEQIYAEILGYGNTSDAFHETAPHERGRGAIRAMQQALYKAGLQPKAIDHINAHATSTGFADGLELDACTAVFGEKLIPNIPITAPKDRIGHMVGAAGAVESVLSLLSMRDGFIPGMVNLRHPRRSGFDLVTGAGRVQEIRRVLKNSFGFGGINASIIFEKWTE